LEAESEKPGKMAIEEVPSEREKAARLGQWVLEKVKAQGWKDAQAKWGRQALPAREAG
jgi:hypothetical protein